MASSKSENRPSYGQYSLPPEESGHKCKSLAPLFCASLTLWLGVLALGIVIGLGCVYNDGTYIVRLSSNDSNPMQVSLGYAGTCVKTNESSACISHLAFEGKDTDSIAEQFQRELEAHRPNNNTEIETGSEPSPHVNSTRRTLFRGRTTHPGTNDTFLDISTLKTLLGITSNLQNDVFSLGAPLSFLIVFALSTLVLWCLLVSPADTVLYKAMLATAILSNSYGLTLGFMVALATRQACKGLIVPWTGDTGVLDATAGIYIEEGDTLQALQWVVVVVSAALQGCVAWLFVQRRGVEDDVQVSVLPTVVNNISFTKNRRCCCCF